MENLGMNSNPGELDEMIKEVDEDGMWVQSATDTKATERFEMSFQCFDISQHNFSSNLTVPRLSAINLFESVYQQNKLYFHYHKHDSIAKAIARRQGNESSS